MAAPMRDSSSSGGNQPTTAANFEYDDNEWDIGIGDLIIDLDADIEKTGVGEGSMAAPKPGKMHSPVEHQATVDKGLKMKIKRTKPGTKHEIVKTGENGEKHSNSAKRGSSSHKRDKKHGDKPSQKDVNGVVRCVERVVYPVTPPIKEKDSQSSGMKKVKSGMGGSGGGSSSGGNVSASGNGNSGVVLQCPTVPSSSNHQSTVGSSSGSSSSGQQSQTSHAQSSQQQCPPSPSQQPSLLQAQSPLLISQQSSSTSNSSTSSNSSSSSMSQPPQLVPVLPLQALPPNHSVQQLQPPTLQGMQAPNIVGTGLMGSSSSHGAHSSSSPMSSSHPLSMQVLTSALDPRCSSPPSSPPPLNHHPRELVDVCVGTSVGTITEPDCLGPCEPGTSVTLEGIVWHETEGVLVVNVTWRGKTYVGTLLDCTRHDWAPPRFCDSPTSDMDARTPKGRGKRGRSAAHSAINDLSNFTETRSSVHSKLRSNNSNGSKGRRGPGAASPTSFAAPKVEATPGKRKATKVNEEEPTPKRKIPPSQPTSPLPPPALLECPEPNCSKKYKHINGLKYHQSHAHGSPDDDETKESGTSEEEESGPIPDLKKDESSEMPLPISEDTLPELPEEKPVLRYEESSNMSQESPIPPPAVTPVSVSTPPPPQIPSPPPNEDSQSMGLPSLPPILTKVPQFKVKPTSLISEDKKASSSSSIPSPNMNKSSNSPGSNHKKKNRKSPSGSPHPSPLEPPALGLEAGREDVQSPAYSDISDDGAPVLESEVEGKPKPNSDKKEDSPQLQHFGMYPYYGQPPYLVPSVSEKPKEQTSEKTEKSNEKDKKESSSDYQQKLLSQHYYQYGYHVPGYSYNMDGYPVVVDDKKDEKAASSVENKTVVSSNTPLHIPNPTKSKSETVLSKEKHPQNESHQILKESIDLKNQVNPAFLFHRQQAPAPPPQSQEDVRRFYIYSDNRKDSSSAKVTPPPSKTLASPSPKHKEKSDEKKDRRDDESKKQQEGVKPTMETQGPPPPPTSQYAYIHPGYMQSPHYGTLPFEPVYRGMNPMLVSSYPNPSYLHAQLHAVPRYAPEDLSRSQSGKALDLLQHHASQYYAPSHKIHELQERAIKSPTPKTATATSSPSAGSVSNAPPVTSAAAVQVQGKPGVSDPNKDARSPPPQRHVHTHHHTHVGLGYPILAGQYPAPYGAAVLATEHAAAVTSVPYQAK